MAFALVGTIGVASQGASGAAVTPAWGTGESRTANNLLICFVSVDGSTSNPSTPSGWSVGQAGSGTSCSIVIYYKIATGGDAAPTIGAITGAVISAQLAEFSGNATSSPKDTSGGASGTSSPITATLLAADTASGELLVMAGSDFRSANRAPNDTWTSNHGTVTQAGNNNGTSTANHYSFGYITSTTSNSGADTAIMTCSSTQSITGLSIVAVSFKLAPQTFTSSPTGTLSFVGSETEKTSKILSVATLSFAGVFNKIRLAFQSLIATLSFVGTFRGIPQKLFTAAASFIGTGIDRTAYHLTSTLSFIGILPKTSPRLLAGTLNFVGLLTRAFPRTLTGTISFIGTKVSSTAYHLAATLSLIGKFVYPWRQYSQLSFSIGQYSQTINDFSTAASPGHGVAQIFVAGNNSTVQFAQFLVNRTGVSSGPVTVQFYNTTGSPGSVIPTGASLATSDSIDASTFTSSTTPATKVFTFSGAGQIQLTPGTTYAAAVMFDSGGSGNISCYGRILSGYSQNTAAFNGSTWNAVVGFNRNFSFVINGRDLSLLSSKIIPAALSFVATVTRAVTKSVAAAILFVGTIILRTSKLLTATLSFAGSLVKSIPRSFTGALSFVGSIVKTSKKLIQSFTGFNFLGAYAILNRTQPRSIGNYAGTKTERGVVFTAKQNGTITTCGANLSILGSGSGTIVASIYAVTGVVGSTAIPTGSPLATSDTLSESLIGSNSSWFTFKFSGSNPYNVTAGTSYAIVIDGTGSTTDGVVNILFVTTDGSPSIFQSNSCSRAFGTSSWIGQNTEEYLVYANLESLTKKTTHLLSAAISFIGSIVKSTSRSITATVSFAGSLTKTTLKALSAAISFIGNLATIFIHGGQVFTQALAGAISFSGSIVNSISYHLSGAVSFIGSITKRISHLLSASASFIGSFTTSSVAKVLLTAALSFSGAISNQVKRALTATLSFSGSITRQVRKTLTASLSFIGSLVKFTSDHLSGSLSFVGSVVKSTSYHLLAACGFVGNATKRTSTSRSASLRFVGSITKLINKLFSASVSFIGTMTRSLAKALSGAISFASAFTKRTGYHLNSILSFVGDLSRAASGHFFQSLSATLNFTGTLKRDIGYHLASTLSFIGTFAKKLPKSLTGALSFIGSFSKRAGKQLTGTLSFAGAITNQIRKLLASALSFIGTRTIRIPKALTGAVSFSGSLIRQLIKLLTGSVSFLGSLTKRIGKLLSGALSFIGDLSTGGLVFRELLTAALTFSGALQKRTSHILSGVIAFIGNCPRVIGTMLSATISFVGTVLHTLGKMFTAVLGFTGSIQKAIATFLSSVLEFIVEFVPRLTGQFRVAFTATLDFSGFLAARIPELIRISLEITTQVIKTSVNATAAIINVSLEKTTAVIQTAVDSTINTVKIVIKDIRDIFNIH